MNQLRSPYEIILRLVLTFLLLCLCSPSFADRNATAASLNEKGIQLYEKQDYRGAISIFKQALELSPKNDDILANLTRAWVGLGLESLSVGEIKTAKDAFQQALKQEDDFYARFGLGYISFLNRDYNEARQQLETVRKLNPKFAKVYKILGIIEYNQGSTKRGLELLQRAVRLDPKDSEASRVLKRWQLEVGVTKSFKSLEIKRFKARYSTKLPVSVIRVLVGHLDKTFLALKEEFGEVVKGQLTVLFFTPEEFKKATGAYHWVGGIFDGQIKIPVSDEQLEPGSARADLLKTLQHELVHGFIKFVQPSCPNWLNEGIAQYYELIPLKQGSGTRSSLRASARVSEQRKNRREQVAKRIYKEKHRRVSFLKLKSNLWELNNESEARWSYLQGLSFVQFLSDRFGAFRLRLLLEASGELGSIQEAFKQTYGKDLDELEKQWWSHLVKIAHAE